MGAYGRRRGIEAGTGIGGLAVLGACLEPTMLPARLGRRILDPTPPGAPTAVLCRWARLGHWIQRALRVEASWPYPRTVLNQCRRTPA